MFFSRHNLQIVYGVIQLIPIFMMHNLISLKWSSKYLFH